MEIDMSHYGLPPLYIGANVGASWSDGKVDELEAPVLLMDEKIAEMHAMLARGETLPTYDDPKAVWADEISHFALRQVEKEIRENNYTTMAECYKNIRIMKYSRHFNVTRVIEGKEKSCSFDNNVIQLLLDRNNTADSVWANFEDYTTNMDLVKFKPTSAAKQSTVLPDDKNGFLEVLREHIQYDRELQVLTLRLVDMDSKFLTILDSILVDRTALSYFRENQQFCNVKVYIGDSYEHQVKFKGLLSGFMPTIKDLMETHIRGEDYLPFQNVADRVGNTLLKETFEQEA